METALKNISNPRPTPSPLRLSDTTRDQAKGLYYVPHLTNYYVRDITKATPVQKYQTDISAVDTEVNTEETKRIF